MLEEQGSHALGPPTANPLTFTFLEWKLEQTNGDQQSAEKAQQRDKDVAAEQ
jgi:hypothetical protein